MEIEERRYSVEEYWEIALLPENEHKRLELINGVIVEKSPSSTENGVLAARIAHLLLGFVAPKRLGYVTGPGTAYRLGPNSLAQTDAAFISPPRTGTLGAREFPVGPDLAVEVVSPSETAASINDKVKAYFGAGTRQVWLVFPTTHSVHVYHASDEVQTLSIEGEIDASSVLPGFTLKVAQIFEPVRKS